LNARSSKSAKRDPGMESGRGLKDHSELKYEPAPVRVFVVWHPRYAEGEAAFKALYDWLALAPCVAAAQRLSIIAKNGQRHRVRAAAAY
jgi:hypothetical protein